MARNIDNAQNKLEDHWQIVRDALSLALSIEQQKKMESSRELDKNIRLAAKVTEIFNSFYDSKEKQLRSQLFVEARLYLTNLYERTVDGTLSSSDQALAIQAHFGELFEQWSSVFGDDAARPRPAAGGNWKLKKEGKSPRWKLLKLTIYNTGEIPNASQTRRIGITQVRINRSCHQKSRAA